MKLRVMSSNLLPALTTAVRAINPRTTLPVLEGVLFRAEDGALVIQSTNLELGFSIPVPAKVDESGAVVIPGKKLLTVVKNASKNGLVEIALLDKDVVAVKAGIVTHTLHGIDAEEFPVMLAPEGESFWVEGEALRGAIHATIKAADTGTARPILQGLSVHSSPGGLTLAAADNYRMAVAELDGVVPEDLSLVIPAKGLAEVERLLAKPSSSGVTVTPNPAKAQVFFEIDDVTFVSRLIDGTYPNYQQVIPIVDPERTITIDKAALGELVTVAKGADTATLRFLGGEVQISGHVLDDTFEASIPVEMNGLDMLVWSVDPAYILDMLASVPGDELEFFTAGPASPGVFIPVGYDIRHVIMPRKLT